VIPLKSCTICGAPIPEASVAKRVCSRECHSQAAQIGSAKKKAWLNQRDNFTRQHKHANPSQSSSKLDAILERIKAKRSLANSKGVQ
jgi:hypothetical protein